MMKSIRQIYIEAMKAQLKQKQTFFNENKFEDDLDYHINAIESNFYDVLDNYQDGEEAIELVDNYIGEYVTNQKLANAILNHFKSATDDYFADNEDEEDEENY